MFYSTFNPLAYSYTARLVSLINVHRDSCGLAKPANASLHFAVQEWVDLRSPALCHHLRLPRSAPGKAAQGTSDTLVGTLSLSAALPSVVSRVSRLVTLQVSRERGLDAYLAVLRCTAQGEALLMLSTKETIKL